MSGSHMPFRSRSPSHRTRDRDATSRERFRRDDDDPYRGRPRNRYETPPRRPFALGKDGGAPRSRSFRRSRSPVRRTHTYPQAREDLEARGGRNEVPGSVSPSTTRRESIQTVTSPSHLADQTSKDDSLSQAFDNLARALSDTSHWWSESYKATKRVQKLRQSMPQVSSDYGSQTDLYKAQLKDQQAQQKSASERHTRAQKIAQEKCLGFLGHPEVGQIIASGMTSLPLSSSGLDSTKQHDLENRIASLENGYNTTINSQSQQIALLEAKVKIYTDRAESQMHKMTEQATELSSLSKALKSAEAEIKQLKSDSWELRAANQNGPEIARAEIRDLHALNKQYSRQIKDIEVETKRLGQQLRDLAAAKSQPTPSQRVVTKDDLLAFAKREDLAMLVTKEDAKGFALQRDLESLAKAEDLKTLASTINDLNETYATKKEMQSLASKDEAQLFAAREEVGTTVGACEKKISIMGKDITAHEETIHEIANNLDQLRASTEDFLGARDSEKSQDLSPRVLALENIVDKKLNSVDFDHLKLLTRRDFSTEISELVSKQVSKVPQAEHTPAPSPVPAPSTLSSGSIVVEVKKLIQEDLKGITRSLGPFIDAERKERDILAERLSKFGMDLTALDTRLTEELGRLRTDNMNATEQFNGSILQVAALTESVSGLGQQYSRMADHINSLSEQHNAIMQLTADQYNQIIHQQNSLAAWQQQFSTKAIYAEIVATMQELVPNGTMARIRSVEVRVENVERALTLSRTQ